MDKRFLGFLAVLALVLGGIFFFFNTDKASAPDQKSSATSGLTNHVTGKGTTGVKLVEYGDFQCPACAAYEPAVAQVRQKYGDQITFQFRNFPLTQIHPNAIASARAAEAADIQGKYWEMHDLLYQNQKEWEAVTDTVTVFNQYATQLGLDVNKFKSDFKSSAINDRVQNDLKEGLRLEVSSTPTFFLNGKKISNPNPTLEAFSKIIDAEIVKKGGKPATSNAAPDPAGTTPVTHPAPTATPAPAGE